MTLIGFGISLALSRRTVLLCPPAVGLVPLGHVGRAESLHGIFPVLAAALQLRYPTRALVLGLATSIAGLLEHDHKLAAYCPRCDRWTVLDLEAMVAAGHGSRRLPIRVRCRECGEAGVLQVRPPVPTRWGLMPGGQALGIP